MTQNEQPCILLVDDDADMLDLMRTALEKDGHHVETMLEAPSREDLQRLDPALVFLDVELDGENGAALCSAIKHDGAETRPVILISGHPDEVLRAEAAGSAADGTMAKPFSMRDLREWAALYVGQPAGAQTGPTGPLDN